MADTTSGSPIGPPTEAATRAAPFTSGTASSGASATSSAARTGAASSATPSGLGTAATHSRDYPALSGHLVPRRVRVGHHDGFDRVVVDHDGSGALQWSAKYVAQPRDDTSEGRVDVRGKVFLEVRTSGLGYPESGSRRITTSGVDQSSIISGVVELDPFEARPQLFIGLDSRRPYRVQVVGTRLVVDISNS